MQNIRQALIDIGATNPKTRAALRPIVKSAAWDKLPKGWTDESVKKFWNTLTGQNKHKVTKCIKEMKGKFDDPGAFCASLADKVEGTTMWRGKKATMDPKTASKTKRALAEVFSEVKPFLKDWNRFLNIMSNMDEWSMDLGEPDVWDINTSDGVTSVEIGHHHPHDPDYQDMDVDVVDGVNAKLGTKIDFRELARRMLGWFRSGLTDSKGFVAALLRIGKDREKLVLLGKTLAPLLIGQYKPDVNSRIEDELFAGDALQLSNDFDYEIEDVDFGRSQFKIVPNGLHIWVDISVSFDVTASGRSRWASAIAPTGKTAADVRKTLYKLFEGVQPYVKDYSRFLAMTEKSLLADPLEWTEMPTVENIKVGKDTWERNEAGEDFLHPVEIVSDLTMDFEAVVDFRSFPKYFAFQHQSQITDRRGFLQVVQDMMLNRAAVMMLGKIMSSYLFRWFKNGTGDLLEWLGDMDSIYETADRAVEGVMHNIDEGIPPEFVGRPRFKATNRGLVISTPIKVWMGIENISMGIRSWENDPDYRSPTEQRRWEFQQNRLASQVAKAWMKKAVSR